MGTFIGGVYSLSTEKSQTKYNPARKPFRWHHFREPVTLPEMIALLAGAAIAAVCLLLGLPWWVALAIATVLYAVSLGVRIRLAERRMMRDLLRQREVDRK